MDIIYVKVKDRNIIIHAVDGIYEGSLTNQLELILRECGFARLNQNTIGFMKNMKALDKKLKMAYFEDGKVFPIQVSRVNMRHVSTLFDNQN